MNKFFTQYLWKGLELLAVMFNLLYTWFYLQQNSWCFLFGILGPLMLLLVCLRVKIYADAGLQIVYAGLSMFGWWSSASVWKEKTWSFGEHMVLLLVSSVLWLVTWQLLRKKTDAAFPLIDAFCSVFALSGTLLMMNFVHANWLYFIVVNAVSLLLYFNRKLYFASAMFLVYLLMAIDGYFRLSIFAA
jgi:nicotinamide mononucleotide transporter